MTEHEIDVRSLRKPDKHPTTTPLPRVLVNTVDRVQHSEGDATGAVWKLEMPFIDAASR